MSNFARMSVSILVFGHLKDMYKDDPNFKESYEACDNLVSRDKTPWTKYMLHDGFILEAANYVFPNAP